MLLVHVAVDTSPVLMLGVRTDIASDPMGLEFAAMLIASYNRRDRTSICWIGIRQLPRQQRLDLGRVKMGGQSIV